MKPAFSRLLKYITAKKYLIWKSASGRFVVWPVAKSILWGSIAGFIVLFILISLNLYNPLLHKYGGDWTGLKIFDLEKVSAKLWQDNHAAIANLLYAEEPPTLSKIPTINLWLNPNSLEVLNQEILQFAFGNHEKKPRVKGMVQNDDGKIRSIQASFRGLSGWHHQFWKPSLRIRYKKNELVDGFRNHILIAPESPTNMRNWLSTQLAQEWGMLSDQEHFVRLFINRKYYGIYSRLWRFDESLLIQEKRLPGPFFRLELREFRRDILYPVLYVDFWDKERWELKGVEEKEGHQYLETMFHVTTLKWGKEQFQKINQILDAEVMAQWLAVRCHSGEVHIGHANVALWLDTTTGKFVPILVDTSGYSWAQYEANLDRPLISINHMPITRKWLQYPPNLALYLKKLEELLSTFGSTVEVEKRIRKQWKLVRPDAMADLSTSEMGSKNLTYTRSFFPVTQLDQDIDTLCSFVEKRTKKLLEKLAAAAVSLISQEKKQFTILVSGLHGVKVSHRHGANFQIKGYPKKINSLHLPTSLALKTNFGELDFWPIPHFNRKLATPSYSFYTLEGKPDDYCFYNIKNGKTIEFSPLKKDKVLGLQRFKGPHPFDFLEEQSADVVLGPGEIRFHVSKEYQKGQKVKILPGTKIILGPKVSLFFRGPLIIQGTKNKPVSIRSKEADKPFGVIALIGKETEGSQIHYLDCKGGSVAQKLNLKFSGMFSVRDCPKILLTNCRFGANFLGDDAVHFMRCDNVKFEACRFENARSDGVDWDKVKGEISQCHFSHAGNDGFDLSLGEVTIKESIFENCGDKGISVGEGSKAVIAQCRLIENHYGIAVKDTSVASLEQNFFKQCRIAVSAYRKKWRWEKGGKVLIKENHFEGSKEYDLQGDASSLFQFEKAKPKTIHIAKKTKIIIETRKKTP